MKQSASHRTAKAIRRRAAKTHRTGRRGLQDALSVFQSISGYNANTLGIAADTTYGEATAAGIQTLVMKFRQLQPSADTFVDLGCGVGKVLVGVATLVSGIQCIGYEIVPDRIRAAGTALARVPPDVRNRIQIHLANFLDTSVRIPGHRVWIFVSNLLLTPEHQAALAELLDRRAPIHCTVLCSAEIPFATGSGFRLVESGIPMRMSWSDMATVMAYQRS
jgi:SAM-dependent methyltransferase